jgi:hypothetical protein
MFADSLLESAPHPGHRAAWSKLVSVFLQCLALAFALSIPLFHVERLQFVPPLPSIRMTNVQQPPVMHQESAATPNSASSVAKPDRRTKMDSANCRASGRWMVTEWANAAGPALWGELW